jgi:hypothetical protein
VLPLSQDWHTVNATNDGLHAQKGKNNRTLPYPLLANNLCKIVDVGVLNKREWGQGSWMQEVVQSIPGNKSQPNHTVD